MGGGKFAILNPCAKKWSDLEGEGRARFCASCKTHVHSITDYSPREWNRLWRDSNGHVCGFLNGESSTRPRSRRAILFGALLTAVSPLFAATGRVRFRVVDTLGRIPHASISLVDSDDQVVRTLETDGVGELIWMDLPLGDAQFTISPPEGQKKRVTIPVRGRKEVKVEVRVSTPRVGVVVITKEREHGWLIY